VDHVKRDARTLRQRSQNHYSTLTAGIYPFCEDRGFRLNVAKCQTSFSVKLNLHSAVSIARNDNSCYDKAAPIYHVKKSSLKLL